MQDNSMFECQNFDSPIDEIVGVPDSLSNLFTGEALINDFPSIWELDATETVSKKLKNEFSTTNASKEVSFEELFEPSFLKESGWLCQSDKNQLMSNSGATTDVNHLGPESGSLNVTLKKDYDHQDRVEKGWNMEESSTRTDGDHLRPTPTSVEPEKTNNTRFSKKNNKGIY